MPHPPVGQRCARIAFGFIPAGVVGLAAVGQLPTHRGRRDLTGLVSPVSVDEVVHC